MALELKFGIKDTATCKAFYLYDASGAYNASTNTGGWGAPNVAIADIDEATFRIVGGSIDKTIDVFPTLPKAEANVEVPTTLFPILNTDLDLEEDVNIPSNIYLGTYTVTTNTGIEYTDEHYIYIDCAHQCCADEMMKNAIKNRSGACECSYQPYFDALYVQGLIKAIHASISPSCNELETARGMVTELNAICASSGCGCS